MSEQEIERFTKDLASDEDLRSAAAEAVSDLPAIVAIAKANGYDFTLEELETFQSRQSAEMSDEDLEKVSAGAFVDRIP
ncbi:MAG: Nif11-like leader peptide family natural product precursor [Pseudomonadota bacterium]